MVKDYALNQSTCLTGMERPAMAETYSLSELRAANGRYLLDVPI